MPITDDI